jgi:hypothetical protein
MTITRRRILAATLLAAAAVTTFGTPAGAIPRDFDHAVFWRNVLLRATKDSSGADRLTEVLITALHDTAVSLGAPGEPVIARVPRLPKWNYDHDMNLDAAAFAVLSAVLPEIDFRKDLQIARATPPRGEPGPEGWSVSVGEGAARQTIAAYSADALH